MTDEDRARLRTELADQLADHVHDVALQVALTLGREPDAETRYAHAKAGLSLTTQALLALADGESIDHVRTLQLRAVTAAQR